MADTKTSLLPTISGVNTASNDVIPYIDVSQGTSGSKSITLAELTAALKLIGFTLDDLTDATVDIPSVLNQALIYNGTTWHNTAISGAIVSIDPSSLVNTAGVTTQSAIAGLDAAITSAAGTGIPATLADAAGDMLVATADNTFAKKTKGSNYTFLGVNGSGAVVYLDPRSVPVNVNTQTGTTYTLVFTDAGKEVTCSNAGSITLTVPPAASVAFPAGTSIDLTQYGAGQVTVAQGAGVTVQTASSLKLRTQWSGATLRLTATADQWVLTGDLEPLGQSINAQTGTTYTFVLTDTEKLVTASNGSAQTYTVPPNSTSAFPIGTHIDIIQIGVGQVTIAQGAGVTVNGTPTLKFRAQHSGASLEKIATNTWQLVGDLASS